MFCVVTRGRWETASRASAGKPKTRRKQTYIGYGYEIRYPIVTAVVTTPVRMNFRNPLVFLFLISFSTFQVLFHFPIPTSVTSFLHHEQPATLGRVRDIHDFTSTARHDRGGTRPQTTHDLPKKKQYQLYTCYLRACKNKNKNKNPQTHSTFYIPNNTTIIS